MTLLAFFAWAVSPGLALARKSVSAGQDPRVGVACLLGVVGLAAYAVPIYQEGFFGKHLDALSSLLFIFIPLNQWLGVAALLLVLALWRKRYGA